MNKICVLGLSGGPTESPGPANNLADAIDSAVYCDIDSGPIGRPGCVGLTFFFFFLQTDLLSF